MKFLFWVPAYLIVTIMLLSGCANESSHNSEGSVAGKLIIFHAGSLSVPMRVLADSFNVVYPDVIIQTESAGSLTSIRKITDLKRECDILASADASMIDKLMIPEYADWNLRFAVNEMALVYHPGSKMSDEINSSNWLDIIGRNDIFIGRADPSTDPCGYRTVLTMRLAEKMLRQDGLANRILAKDKKYIRPKEVDLLALLETNTVDYIFLYKSVAMQHNLPFIQLNDSINLKNPDLNEWYSTVSVEVPGNSPNEKIVQRGEAMVYGITIPRNSPNKSAAEAFIKFLKEEGAPIIKACHQTPI
jgi:molybdate/tungstate transport system substrate-binding protein